jgi:hypothetical protein
MPPSASWGRGGGSGGAPFAQRQPGPGPGNRFRSESTIAVRVAAISQRLVIAANFLRRHLPSWAESESSRSCRWVLMAPARIRIGAGRAADDHGKRPLADSCSALSAGLAGADSDIAIQALQQLCNSTATAQQLHCNCTARLSSSCSSTAMRCNCTAIALQQRMHCNCAATARLWPSFYPSHPSHPPARLTGRAVEPAAAAPFYPSHPTRVILPEPSYPSHPIRVIQLWAQTSSLQPNARAEQRHAPHGT